MAALTTKLPKDTYKDLLQVSNSNSGVDATLRNVSDGEGTASALALSTTVVGVEDGVVGGPGLAFTDDPDNGLYRIGANNWGAAVAGALAMEFDPIGAVQFPLQPCFLVNPATAQSNIAAGSIVTVVWGTEVIDINGDFASNAFTAPVTSTYLLTVTLLLVALDSAASYYDLRFVASNRSISATEIAGAPIAADGGYYFHLTSMVDMDAADTVTVGFQQTAGTNQTDIAIRSVFSGCLIA